ncbi:HAD-like domain-containing protein [Aspergillus oleicola]
MAACCIYGAFVVSIFLRKYQQAASVDLSSYSLLRHAQVNPGQDNNTSSNRVLSLKVHGISCASCVESIEDKFLSLQGIKIARVDPLTGLLDIVYDNQSLSPATITGTVERLGFVCEKGTAEDEDALHPGRTAWDWGLAFSWSLPLLCPILALDLDLVVLLDDRTKYQYLLILAGIMQGVFGWPFYRTAILSVRNAGFRHLPMDVLIAWSTSLTYVMSIWFYTRGIPVSYAATSGTLLSVISLNKYLEAQFRVSATAALVAFAEYLPAHAYSFALDRQVPPQSLKSGDQVLVGPGERFPCDGILVPHPHYTYQNRLLVNESLQTGESRPTEKSLGDVCLAGTLNTSQETVLLSTLVGGGRSRISEIIDVILRAQRKNTKLQLSAERLASAIVPSALTLSLLSLLYWLPDGVDTALKFMTATLVVACPCALGLSVPAALMIASGFTATRGVIFKGGALTMQGLCNLTTVAFDKTGTLTSGELTISRYQVRGAIPEEKWWELLSAAEQQAPDHWARSVVLGYFASKFPGTAKKSSNLGDLRHIPGHGIRGKVGQHCVCIGNAALLRMSDVSDIGGDMERDVAQLRPSEMCILVAVDSLYAGYVCVRDPIANDALPAIRALQRRGIKCCLITGDRDPVAADVASQLGIEQFWSGLTPIGKVNQVRQLQSAGNVVALVGDGINDAAALATADVGISLGSGTSVALASSDVVVLDSALSKIDLAISVAKHATTTMRTSVAWAYLYNAVGMPLAMGFGFPYRISISPSAAGFLMMGSSLGVMLNSIRLQRRLSNLSVAEPQQMDYGTTRSKGRQQDTMSRIF